MRPNPTDSDTTDAEVFITRWRAAGGSERANCQLFVGELCALLGLPAPEPARDDQRDNAYVFERRISFAHGDGSSSAGFIDCYRRGAFVLEAKKLRAGRDGAPTKGFDDALLRARAQAEGYARALPAAEGRPPFLVVVDVGHVIELYAEFTRSGATYTPFPDARSHRIAGRPGAALPGPRPLARTAAADPGHAGRIGPRAAGGGRGGQRAGALGGGLSPGLHCPIVRRSAAMTDTAQALTEAALKLPPEDRERMVERLIASLDQGSALPPDWHDEIVRRLSETQAGCTRFVPAEEAMARLTAHIHARRTDQLAGRH